MGRFWEDFLCQDPRAVSRSPAERLNARGSSTPRVLDVLEIRPSQFLPWEGLRPLWRRVRAGCRKNHPDPLGGVLGTFFAFFRIFFAFWAHLKSSWHFFTIFFDFLSILDGFGEDFGRILEGFFEGLSIVSQNCQFCQIQRFTKEKPLYLLCRALEK